MRLLLCRQSADARRLDKSLASRTGETHHTRFVAVTTQAERRTTQADDYCALVQLLLDECPDGTLFIAPECKQAASAYLGKQDKLQSFCKLDAVHLPRRV